MNFKEIVNQYLGEGKNKKSSNLVLVFLIGVVLVITASFFKSFNSNNITNENVVSKNNLEKINSETVDKTVYEQDIKNQLKGILGQIEGVGRVEVMITFESGEETVPAVNNNNDATSSTQDTSSGDKSSTTQGNSSSTVVITNEQDGSTRPLIVKTYKPKVCGVCIVAQGAEDSLTELRITKSVMDLLNIADSKVNVYPMKK